MIPNRSHFTAACLLPQSAPAWAWCPCTRQASQKSLIGRTACLHHARNWCCGLTKSCGKQRWCLYAASEDTRCWTMPRNSASIQSLSLCALLPNFLNCLRTWSVSLICHLADKKLPHLHCIQIFEVFISVLECPDFAFFDFLISFSYCLFFIRSHSIFALGSRFALWAFWYWFGIQSHCPCARVIGVGRYIKLLAVSAKFCRIRWPSRGIDIPYYI